MEEITMEERIWVFIIGMLIGIFCLTLIEYFVGNPIVSYNSQVNLQRCLVSVPDGCYARTVRSPEPNMCTCINPLGKLEYQIDWDR